MPPTERSSSQGLYGPITKDSKEIRVLTIQKAAERKDPIVCNLSKVDLNDQTDTYEEALAVFNSGASIANLTLRQKGPTRHVFWDYWNRDPAKTRVSWDGKMAQDVAEHESLHDFCDVPLETFGNRLPDRFQWGDYMALSYVWGDQTNPKKITIDGRPFNVGQNLYDALLRLRTSYEVATRNLKVWIDAICINQGDMKERAVEVKKMDLIYSEALVTWCWLGEFPERPPLIALRERLTLGFSVFEALGRGDVDSMVKASGNPDVKKSARNILQKSGLANDHRQHQTPKEMLDGFQLYSKSDYMTKQINPYIRGLLKAFFRPDDDVTQIFWRLISEITEAPYWHRVWISQEIALSSSVVFWSGDLYLTIKELFVTHWVYMPNLMGQYVNDVQDLIRTSTLWYRVMIVLTSLRQSRSAEYQKSTQYLKEIIDKGRDSAATDPKDKVYGLLAIMPPQIASLVQPDYEDTWTWQDTWTDFTRICLEYEQRLDMVGRCAGPESGIGLASWAFNLKSPKPRLEKTESSNDPATSKLEGLVSYAPTQLNHRASFADRGLSPSFHFPDDGRTLRCRGILIDAVGTMATMSECAPSTNQQLPDDFQDRKLSLARVMMEDSTYQFSDGPSLLDVPYLDRKQIISEVVSEEFKRMERHREVPYTRTIHKLISQWTDRNISETDGKKVPWRVCYLTKGFFNGWHERVVPFQGFEIGGRPLREYFNSQDEFCQNWPQFQSAAQSMVGMKGRRLFHTRKGRLGTVADKAVYGDTIAVIYGCNIPVVLRQKGDGYELIGNCFVDGLMDGEVKDMLDRGDVLPTEISIY